MFKDELVKLMSLMEVYESTCAKIKEYGSYPLSNATAYYLACKKAKDTYFEIVESIKKLCECDGTGNGLPIRAVINCRIDWSLECSIYVYMGQAEPIADYLNLSDYIEMEW
jgi:hypothetical protein